MEIENELQEKFMSQAKFSSDIEEIVRDELTYM